MQNQNNTNPMETGSIPKLLAQLAIPAVVAQIINLLYNIVDRIYIGHIPGIYFADRACRYSDNPLLHKRTNLIKAFRCKQCDHVLCHSLCKNLYSRKFLCTDRTWYESFYHYTGICKNQYDDHRHRCCDQYHP